MKKVKKNKDFDVRTFILKELRGSFRKSPLYSQTKNKFKEYYYIDSKNGKKMKRVHYKCAMCGDFFMDKTGNREIAVDHIESIMCTKTGPTNNIDIIVRRLFCNLDNLQVLCNYKGERDGKLSCHRLKSSQEKADMATVTRFLKGRNLETVDWKTIPGDQHKEISNTGVVRCKRTEAIIKNSGLDVRFLVGTLFVDNPDKCANLSSIDGDDNNIFANNLKWV